MALRNLRALRIIIADEWHSNFNLFPNPDGVALYRELYADPFTRPLQPAARQIEDRSEPIATFSP